MKIQIRQYNAIQKAVNFFSNKLKNIFDKFKKSTGRKSAVSINDILAIALFKNKHGIPTKKSVYEILDLKDKCSYKTLVVNINRFAPLAAAIIALIMKMNRRDSHLVKHIDSTGIPVCLFKNAKKHKTMKGLAAFSKNSKGVYYGLKLHLISDLHRSILALKFTPANTDDRKPVPDMCKGINGFIIADAGYISDKLAREICIEGKRIFIAKPRKNMKKLMTKFEEALYKTRFRIEYNFRDLKMFKGLITSMPRSADGYSANYIYSLLAYQIA